MDPKNNAGDLKRTCKAVVTSMAWHPHESWHIDQANRTPKVSASIFDQQVFHKGATHTHWRKNNFFNKCCRRLPLESPFIPCTKLTVDQRPEWKTGNYEATKIKHFRTWMEILLWSGPKSLRSKCRLHQTAQQRKPATEQRRPQSGRKHLQMIYRTRHEYSECSKLCKRSG